MSKILLSITGEKSFDWASKLKEINARKITEVAVFLERFDQKERDNLYRLLLKSTVQSVPFLHLRDDITAGEMEFFFNRYQTRHFNIHEDHFKVLDRWKGYLKNLYLEMDYNSKIAKDVKVRRIGGFCVDLSHFKAAIERGAEEAYYVFTRKSKATIDCNHLSGYDPSEMKDVHFVKDRNSFDYLVTLPKYVFGKIIALEIDNPIGEQIKFKEHISRLLDDYLLE